MSQKPIAPSRTTFSGQGRPRSGPREPNGRLIRPRKKEKEADVINIALAQPHRRGSLDNRRRWAIGRLVLDGVVKHSRFGPGKLERAAELYAADYARLRWILDSRRPLANAEGQGREPTPEDSVATRKAWSEASRVLRDCGERVVKAMDYVVLDAAPEADERTLAPWIILSLPSGLAALAAHYGLDPDEN